MQTPNIGRQAKWDLDFWDCGGHYHRRIDDLMVNPFTYEVLPDQWCKERRRPKVSGVLWCNVGNHAFSADDSDAEEYTRSKKSKDEYGREHYETTTLNICGKHLGNAIRQISNGGDDVPAGKKMVDEEEYNRYLQYLENNK